MPKVISRGVVTVGTTEHFAGGMNRLKSLLVDEDFQAHYTIPHGSPRHEICPYAFKIWAIEQAPFDMVLWCDSSIIPLKPLDPIWEYIEEHGYWFSKNYNYTNGEFCSDVALQLLGINREDAFKIPHVVATTFGLDLHRLVAWDFLNEWKDLARRGVFNGPWRNDNGEASSDPRVRGHRHDQTAASMVVHRMGLNLTEPPRFFAEQGFPTSDETILTVLR